MTYGMSAPEILLLHAHDHLARSRGLDWKDRLEAAHICWCALIALHSGRTLQEVWKP